MPKPLPSQEILREKLDYDPETGILTWAYSKPGVSKGKVAGSGNRDRGDVAVAIDGTTYRAHRLIWKWMTGEDPPQLIDHINHDVFDNRWENLRLASHQQNSGNIRGFGKLKKGVKKSQSGTTFQAFIRVDGKKKYLGTFPTENEAHQAYCEAADQVHGLFACYKSKVSSKISD